MALDKNLQIKYENLKSILKAMRSVLIAFSGGVDSTLLLKVATDVLHDKCVAVTGNSASVKEEEYKNACKLAEQLGARIETVKTGEFDNPLYLINDKKRCFYCKTDLFSLLSRYAREHHIQYILDGSNADDREDYRPGIEAARNFNIRSPLMEARLSKEDIRKLSKYFKLPTWNKPAQPCLSSRVAYGVNINKDILAKIERAEKVLHEKQFKIVRVRYFYDHVSVEVGQDELKRLFNDNMQQHIKNEFNKIGFINVHFDRDGYRSGKLNL